LEDEGRFRVDEGVVVAGELHLRVGLVWHLAG
jgi:hypothetical protein